MKRRKRSILQIGDRLADARAKAGTYVQVRDADPGADAEALRRLALWGLRYTPLVVALAGRHGRRRFLSRCHRCEPSLRRRSGAAEGSCAPAFSIRPHRALRARRNAGRRLGLVALSSWPARHPACRAKRSRHFRPCPSKPCASMAKPAPPCAGSASRPSAH